MRCLEFVLPRTDLVQTTSPSSGLRTMMVDSWSLQIVFQLVVCLDQIGGQFLLLREIDTVTSTKFFLA